MVNWHFWLATVGIVIYAAVMWVSGITQGLMWREYDEQGFLVYSFAETVAALHPYYIARAVGGLLYLAGALVMAFNIWMTVSGKVRTERAILAPARLTPAE
jgi:cytochrome c oxidase cbb3-type subunit 1